jgi:hypothetical protein
MSAHGTERKQMTDTISENDRQYELAKQMAGEYERIGSILEAINERNSAAYESWEELPRRIVDEHIGDPLDIEWHGHTSSNPAWGDADWDIDYVEVTLGTGGPARGIRFYDADRADCWHQDWFTPRVCATLDSTTAQMLSEHWGLEF